MSNTPKIRFAGFTEDWKQRKIVECASFSKGYGYSKSDILDKGTPLILYGRLYTKHETVIENVDTFAIPVQGSIYSCGGEVIVPASGETADDIAIASVVKESGVLLGGDLNVITTNYEIDPAFLALSISNGKAHRDLSKLAQGKSVVHIHNSDIQSVGLRFPDKIEQEKISGFLVKIDGLIRVHQHEHEKLVALKAACLDKMFPKNDSKVPEIRYEFTGDWEQHRLGDVGKTYTGLSGKTKVDFGHGEGKFITYMNVFANPVSSLLGVEPIEIDDSQNEVQIGDVFFTTSSETPEEVGMSSVLIEKQGVVYLNSFCFGFRPSVRFDPYYLAYMLRSNYVRKQIVFLAQGISRYNISKTKMMDIHIPVPSLEEQKKVGQYFKGLDDLISLQHNKVKKLKQLKQALLNDMFV